MTKQNETKSTETLAAGEVVSRSLHTMKDFDACMIRPYGTRTGFIYLDKMLDGIAPVELLVIAGRPGMGKTALALNIAINDSRISRNTTAPLFDTKVIATPNLSADALGQRLLCLLAKVTPSMIYSEDKNGFRDKFWMRVNEALEFFKHKDIRIFASDNFPNGLEELFEKVRKMESRGDIELLIIDDLDRIVTDCPGGDRTDEIMPRNAGRKLKEFAKERNMAVIVTLPLDRTLELRDNKRPRLIDLGGFGDIEKEADKIMFIYRDSVYHPEPLETSSGEGAHYQTAEIIVEKNNSGPQGMVTLRYSDERTGFFNLKRVDSREE